MGGVSYLRNVILSKSPGLIWGLTNRAIIDLKCLPALSPYHVRTLDLASALSSRTVQMKYASSAGLQSFSLQAINETYLRDICSFKKA